MGELDVERIAGELVRVAGSSDVAFLQDGSRVLWATGEDEPGSPFTATTQLIQGVWEQEPTQARKLLRARIWTTTEPGAFAHGMIKIAARRFAVVKPQEGRGPETARTHHRVRWGQTARTKDEGTERDDSSRQKESTQDWMQLARSLVSPRREQRPKWELDRAVGAALVSPEGELIAASANENAKNRTLHAELIVLARAWELRKSKLPRGTRLFATLEPCKMCAGLAWEMGEEAGAIQVFFGEPEPGPAARGSVLEVGSNARRQYARNAFEREVPCLFRVES